MRKKYASYLVDPLTGEDFTIEVFAEADDDVTDGLLVAKKSWYPIINGVPRIMVKELRTTMLQERHEFYTQWEKKLPDTAKKEWKKALDAIKDLDKFITHQKKTAESFAYEWKTIYRENDFEKNNFLHFMSPFLKEKDFKDKITVDIGCGSGRFTKQAALCGAKIAFGTDLGESVEVAYELNKDIDNVCIIQADIYAMPFKANMDIAYSIGVLHHLPQPKEGFLSLPKVLKKGGKMIIWVYNRRNNGRALYFYEPMRAVLKNLPKPLLYKLCYIPGGAVHAINGITHGLNKLGAKKLAQKIPFSYYANFPFNMKLNDAFDVLATPKSNYYFREQIEDWFKSGPLTDIDAFEHPEAGITCVGTHAP